MVVEGRLAVAVAVACMGCAHHTHTGSYAAAHMINGAHRLNPDHPRVPARRYKPAVDDGSSVGEALGQAQERLGRVVELLQALKGQAPQLTGEFDKVLCHVADVRA